MRKRHRRGVTLTEASSCVFDHFGTKGQLDQKAACSDARRRPRRNIGVRTLASPRPRRIEVCGNASYYRKHAETISAHDLAGRERRDRLPYNSLPTRGLPRIRCSRCNSVCRGRLRSLVTGCHGIEGNLFVTSFFDRVRNPGASHNFGAPPSGKLQFCVNCLLILIQRAPLKQQTNHQCHVRFSHRKSP